MARQAEQRERGLEYDRIFAAARSGRVWNGDASQRLGGCACDDNHPARANSTPVSSEIGTRIQAGQRRAASMASVWRLDASARIVCVPAYRRQSGNPPRHSRARFGENLADDAATAGPEPCARHIGRRLSRAPVAGWDVSAGDEHTTQERIISILRPCPFPVAVLDAARGVIVTCCLG